MAKLSPLASASATRQVLEKHGLTTKKALGQNFLVDDGVVKKICEVSEVGDSDFVLEVGPGIGTLTTALLQKARRVVSVERDEMLIPVLRETTDPWADGFALLSMDALDLSQEDLRAVAPDGMPNKFIANLPYAVAATLVLDYFQRFSFLESATVMVQAEVADRMCAQRGTKNYGAFTVMLSLFAQPKARFAVGPQNFFPPPRVDSAVLRLDRRAVADKDGKLLDPAADPADAAIIDATCIMAHAAFANRRKTIANSCKTYFSGKGETGERIASRIPALLEAAGIDPKVRGEALPTEAFIELGRALHAIGYEG